MRQSWSLPLLQCTAQLLDCPIGATIKDVFQLSYYKQNYKKKLFPRFQIVMEFLGGLNSSKSTIPAMIDTDEGKKRMPLDGLEFDGPVKTTPWERRFNPYDFNGG